MKYAVNEVVGDVLSICRVYCMTWVESSLFEVDFKDKFDLNNLVMIKVINAK